MNVLPYALVSLVLWSASLGVLLLIEAPIVPTLVWTVFGCSFLLVALLALGPVLRWCARGRWTLRLRRADRARG